jgi:hypothetical protein
MEGDEVRKAHPSLSLSLTHSLSLVNRTIAEIRRENQIAIPLNKDSLYKPVTRIRREFGKILVPQKLQEVSLPLAQWCNGPFHTPL